VSTCLPAGKVRLLYFELRHHQTFLTVYITNFCATFAHSSLFDRIMKKIHIVLLVFIAITIGVLVSFMGTLSTYDTVQSAIKKKGKVVSIIAKLDRTHPVEYDAIKNPNYLSFMAYDSLGGNMKVIYRKEKPTNLEHSERLVLKGRMNDDHFECSEILMKCPSKYKDDMNEAKKNLQENAASTPARNSATQYQ
jgi:cytochrome c-type biogenesis protein CcmE